jgi:hypothetical protein
MSDVPMTDRNALLQGILGIGQATSLRGAGISMREALKAAGYAELRPSLTAAELRPFIAVHPEFIEQWLSEDKRTDGGWYIQKNGNIGRVLKPATERHYASGSIVRIGVPRTLVLGIQREEGLVAVGALHSTSALLS